MQNLDEHRFAVRDRAYQTTRRIELEPKTWFKDQKVYCLDHPGKWEVAKILGISGELIKIHIRNDDTPFITNRCNPHIRINKPVTLNFTIVGDWVMVNDQHESGVEGDGNCPAILLVKHKKCLDNI